MNLFRKMTQIIRRLTVRDENAWSGTGYLSDTGEVVTESTVLALDAAWACVNLISGTISAFPLMVYFDNGQGQRKPAKKHSLYRILHESPNFDQTALDFWDFMVAALELKGNAYARIDRNTLGETTALTPIASFVATKRLKNGDIEYRWVEDGISFVKTDKDVLHIRGFGGSPLGGMSTLSFGKKTFGLAQAIDKAASSTFKNGLRPSGTLTFKDFLSQENRQIAETKLLEKFSGAINTGRPMILEGGAEWKQMAINPEDAQMIQSRGFSVEQVCRMFQVPPVLVGHSEKTTSWPSGVEQQVLMFQKFTLVRRTRRIEQALTKQLLSPKDVAAGVVIEFNMEGLLRGDSSARSGFYQSALSNGWMTINEVRSKENLPPLTGGNIARLQMQNVPITENVRQSILSDVE